MPPSNSDDQIRRSRENRDKARNEQQKNVLLNELVRTEGEKCGELSRQCSKLQAESDALIRKSKRLRGRHTFGGA